MKLKVLLVDDEINIIKNLQQVIPWAEMGIDVIGLAKNGVEAMEYVTEYSPDILFTDIRMPVMDGITLLSRVRELNTQCEVLMLTGYQDFDYARSAIQYRAKDYILKPINYVELEETIRVLAEQIRAQKLEKLIEKEKWGRVTNLAYEKVLFDSLMDYSNQEFELVDHKYMMLLVDINEYSRKSRVWDDKERKLWNFAVKNVLQDALQEYRLKYTALQLREGEWCILVEQNNKDAIFELNQTRKMSEVLQQAVIKYVKLQINVKFYPDFVGILNLSECYKKVQRSLQLGAGESQVQASTDFLWNLIEEMVSGLKQCNREKIEQSITHLKLNLHTLSEQSYAQSERILHFLILHLLREMRELKVISVVFEEEVWGELESSKDVKDLMKVITSLIDHSLDKALNKKSTEVFMLSAKDYIDRNLESDLGIDELADFLNISSSYFSLLFKQHFKETFVEYITKQRMEMAKSMLIMSDHSIAKIGKSVGYAERRYFTKVFLKYSGQTPSEYRDVNLDS